MGNNIQMCVDQIDAVNTTYQGMFTYIITMITYAKFYIPYHYCRQFSLLCESIIFKSHIRYVNRAEGNVSIRTILG